MISVTAKSRYAVVGMAELSRHADRPVPISVVAERRGIPVQFLEQLFSTLRRDGLLISQRGAKGGFRLARDAEDARAFLERAGLLVPDGTIPLLAHLPKAAPDPTLER